MAEYTYDAVQLIPAGGNALLNDSIRCTKGYILHENDSGILTFRGIVNNCCDRRARYLVIYNADIAVPAGGTAGQISVALARGGEIIQPTIAIVTPTVVDAYFHVSGARYIDVYRDCCINIAVENNSGQDINMQHLNVTTFRQA